LFCLPHHYRNIEPRNFKLLSHISSRNQVNVMPSSLSTPSQSDPAAAKAALRTDAARQRGRLAAAEPDAATALVAHLDALIAACGGGVYAAYLPIRSELSPLPLVAALAASGIPRGTPSRISTAMPITPEPGLPLTFHEWAPDMPLDAGPYGTQQPPAGNRQLLPDVILAPMLAFDDGGWRLGYGGGFYDRTISGLRAAGHAVTAIGVAYSGQRVATVPTGPYDEAMDAVLTPDGLIWRGAGGLSEK
jgi:5-formyltetrahydrofolate cyclo-ligase